MLLIGSSQVRNMAGGNYNHGRIDDKRFCLTYFGVRGLKYEQIYMHDMEKAINCYQAAIIVTILGGTNITGIQCDRTKRAKHKFS